MPARAPHREKPLEFSGVSLVSACRALAARACLCLRHAKSCLRRTGGRNRFAFTFAARELCEGGAGCRSARRAPGSVCKKGRTHTDMGRHREHAGSPASRAPRRYGLLRMIPGGRTSTAMEFGCSASLSGEFGEGSARTPVTRSRRAGTVRLGPPILPRRETGRSGPKPPVRMMVRVATRPSRGLERVGI